MRRRALPALALLVAGLATLLAGCAGPSNGKATVKSEDAKKAMQSLVEDTQRLFPSATWTAVSGPTANDCTLPDGTTGISWAMAVQTTDRGPLASDVATLLAGWKAKGIRIKTLATTGPNDPVREIVGYPDDLQSIEFVHSQYKNGISAQSVCATR